MTKITNVEEAVKEIERTSEVINPSLWYVKPEDIRTTITALLDSIKEKVEVEVMDDIACATAISIVDEAKDKI